MSKLQCAACGQPMAKSARSLPNGQAICQSCRRRRKPRKARTPKQARTAKCLTCGASFTTKRDDQRWCSKACWMQAPHVKGRPANPIYATKKHRDTRKEYAKRIEAQGGINCCLCGGWINNGEPWHLDHIPNTTDYRGAAHPHCNASEGASRSKYASRYANNGKTPCLDCGKPSRGERCATCASLARRVDKPKRKTSPGVCAACGKTTPNGGTCCSARCGARSKYRERVGLPLDAAPHKAKRLSL